MRKNRKNYAIMANRKTLWLISVVAIAVGLIFNITLGVNTDIRFTGGAMLRYSYPESGIVSAADVPAMAVPETVSDADVQNTEPEPAVLPVIVSGTDTVSQNVSGTDVSDGTEEAVSDSEADGQSASGSDILSGTDISGDIQPDYSTSVDPAVAGRIVSEALGEEVTVSISTDARSPTGGDNKRLTVTIGQGGTLGQEADAVIRDALGEKYPNVVLTLRESNLVDRAISGEFALKCMIAIGLSALFIVLYMGMRYRTIGGWSAGGSAIIAIAHDCLMAYFAFVVFGFPIDDQFVAVVLAIMGLSINSTIVVFDRIRENRTRLSGLSIAEIADKSINETIGRTVSTDLCVFLSMAVLAVVSAIYGIGSMLSFALPMMVGTAAGCYSSLCISCTIWVTWQEWALKRHYEKLEAESE